jgi:hypothetical protein
MEGGMFVVFTLSDGKLVHIDTDVVLAVEELGSGSRIHTASASFAVKETAKAVLEELGADDEDDEDEEDEEDD